MFKKAFLVNAVGLCAVFAFIIGSAVALMQSVWTPFFIGLGVAFVLMLVAMFIGYKMVSNFHKDGPAELEKMSRNLFGEN